MSLHTHYDNLKVARNAPPEVIRAAYKSLSQKFHPDRNPDVDAARIMSILNSSYDVLSESVKRRAHDLWIVEQEASSAEAPPVRPPLWPPSPPIPAPKASALLAVLRHVLRNLLVYGVAGFVAWFAFEEKTPSPGPKPYVSSPPVSSPSQAAKKILAPEYIRPEAAPNGSPWPAVASYIKGYRRLHLAGRSNVTVDNTRNDTDVFVKLVSLESATAYPVRQFFIPAYGSFTLAKVTAGTYDVRYRDLGSGGLSRSDSFVIEETETADGVEFSNMTMTLYKVQNGNMSTHRLAEGEFE